MKIHAHVIRLESWAQEEISAKRRLLERLIEQEQAIASNRADRLLEAGAAVEQELRENPGRERRRRELVGALGRAWGVAPETLTLSSVVERARDEGVEAERLARLRTELRSLAADVLRRGRRIATLARYHQGLYDELLRVITREGGEANGPERPAALIDAHG